MRWYYLFTRKRIDYKRIKNNIVIPYICSGIGVILWGLIFPLETVLLYLEIEHIRIINPLVWFVVETVLILIWGIYIIFVNIENSKLDKKDNNSHKC